MMQCHGCRTLLLDHAYGLLDAAEAASVELHLAGCTACQAAFERVNHAQGLFAKAAKSSFQNVHFEPPVEELAVPFTKPKKARSHWAQWVVAASVLALIPGTLIPVNKLAERYESARRDTEDAKIRTAEAKLAYVRQQGDMRADQQVAAAEQKHIAVVSSWVGDAKSESARKVAVNVTKPQSITPGAPNEYVIAVADPADSLNGSRVEAQFRDQSGQVVHTQPVAVKMDTTVRLPAEAWSRVKPDSELFLSIAAVNASGSRTELQEPIRLFGPIYATLLTTDKTTYRPGEQLQFRSLTLDRVTLRPPPRDQNLRFTFRKADGTGTALELDGLTSLVKESAGTLTRLLDATGQPVRGVGCGSFLLPANLPEGEYTLTLTELRTAGGAAPAMAYPVTKTIQVRAGGPERFAKKLTFTAPSYKPGDKVEAIAELKLGDKPIAGAKGLITLTSDKEAGPFIITPEPRAKNANGTVIQLTGQTDANGRFRITFNRPQGDVKLMVSFDHDGVKESVAERVPLAGADTAIEFFPEGGTLLAGVPNRVYVRGTTVAGKPADVRGTIAAGNEMVAKVDAFGPDAEPGVHRGTGSFTFTPKVGIQYQFKLTGSPAAFDLPKAEADGVGLTSLDTVAKPGQPIRLRVHSVGKDRKLMVGAYTRGRLADMQPVDVKDGTAAVVTLIAKMDARGGVTRLTVFEVVPGQDLVPMAERLVYRKPGEVMNLTADANVKDGAVDLSVSARDENGKPVPAILWAAAVNSAEVDSAKHRSLPTHFLLGGEVQTPEDLEHADFLLTDHPKAAEALDHVLATQGWRRFVEQKQKVEPGSYADSLLKWNGGHRLKAAAQSLAEKHWVNFETTAKDVVAAREQKAATEPMMLRLYAEYETSRRATQDLASTVEAAAGPYDRIRDRLSVASGCVAVLTLMLGALAWVRGFGSAGVVPYVVGAIAASGLAVYFTMDASSNPARPVIVPDHKVNPPAPPSFGNVAPVNLPPKPKFTSEDGTTGETYRLWTIETNIPRTARSPLPSAVKPSVPPELIAKTLRGDFRAPPGQPILDRIAAEEKLAKERAEEFAAERARETLRAIDSALKMSGATADPAAARLREAAPRMAPFVVREYAAPRPGAGVVESDTVMWKPVIVLPIDGRTTLNFNLGPAPGGYQVIVAGHSPDGRLGSTKLLVK